MGCAQTRHHGEGERGDGEGKADQGKGQNELEVIGLYINTEELSARILSWWEVFP